MRSSRSAVLGAVTGALLAAGNVCAQSNTPVSSTIFNNIINYTQYAAASYADSCATPPASSTVVQYFNDSTTDTHATLFRNDHTQEIIIAFRGTASPQNFQTDLQFQLTPLTVAGTSCSTCNVHIGFQSSYESIQTAVLNAVKLQSSLFFFYKVVVVGHSLGGALASLSSASLIGSGVKVSAVYTYGEPRNGDSNWVNYVNGQISSTYYRTTHYNDGVPQLPPAGLGYQHRGQAEYWQSQQSGNTAATTLVCPGVDPGNCDQAQNPGNNQINGAHISYSNQLIGNSLNIKQCGDNAS